MLLVASCYFYMAFIPYYILILGVTIVIDYFAGILIENKQEKHKRKKYLALSIIANVGVLAIFKYYNFFIENIGATLSVLGYSNPIPYLNIILPIGLSFHTFQAMSYTIEVYRGNFKAERHFGIYALYVMYFPQLVAGPIERPQNILPQLRIHYCVNAERIISGLKMMLWGFVKKLVIADRLSVIVNLAYSNPENYDGTSLLIATVFFAFQIYCDFSGYSDIAIGASKILGIDLMENFRTPYVSKSIKEFWERWHISLSSWFRDYLYIPMGGNRVKKQRWYFNLFFVFLISGFWHGANWTYVIWGALHGAFLVISILIKPATDFIKKQTHSFYSPLSMLTTFVLANFAWIFFRAKSISDANIIISKLFTVDAYRLTHFELLNHTKINSLTISALLLMLFICIDPYMDKLIKKKIVLKKPAYNYILFACLLIAIVVFGYFGKTDFIYFQF